MLRDRGEMLARLALEPDMHIREELAFTLVEINDQDLDNRGLKATLRYLTVTSEWEKTKSTLFSDAQPSRMQELTVGICLGGRLL